ncbi:hypothetical protein Mtc_1793 [Methanocella conradii HZ254]|uniref:Uncharacterized protein n=1 Tax=Methanocella conradii (strain DSM 24694 / JCM 17849 / CGMCC 1.5162 / HZ254) TaxID=1041930 RepID=H8I9T6_METCZ|nr:hypothetical protein [Methanocella conradii]AFD00537.1 hypothetical protein Mtc_1793 [Methanocella conradii HZ254]
MKGLYIKSLIIGIIGVPLILLAIYGILAITNAGQSDKPLDVVEGWAVMFFMAVAAVYGLSLIGVISAWWTGKETASIGEVVKSSLISGIIAVTILAVIVLVIFYMYVALLLLIFGLLYLIAIIFSTLGAMFYVFIIRGMGSSLAADPAASAYSMASGLIAGSISMGFIALTWNGLDYITLLQLFADMLVFSAMAACAGIIVTVLLRRKRAVDNGPMFQIGVAGLIVGALTFTAPLVSLLLKGSSIRGISLVFYSLAIPLPIIGGVVLALIGGMLANIFIRPEKATDVKAISHPLPGLFQIELALAGGILMALLMFSPILFAGGASSIAYHGVNNIVNMASFFIVPTGEAIIGALAVRYSHARSMREAASIAGITGAISVFILFIGDMAKNFLHIHSIVNDRPLLDMHAYGGMTNVMMCYPFVLLTLITIAICSGVFEYGRGQRK